MTEVQELCECELAKRDATDNVYLCVACHKYWKGNKRLTSVSKVIDSVVPVQLQCNCGFTFSILKASAYRGASECLRCGTLIRHSRINPDVLEGARLRGIFVDTYFCEWLTDPSGVVPLSDVAAMIAPQFPIDHEKYAADTVQRIKLLLEWWQKSGLKILATQKIVHSDKDGVAGTLDLRTHGGIYDIKTVFALAASYELQIGGYLDMDASAEDCGIIHVTKERIELVPYDAKRAIGRWRKCIDWFNTSTDLRKNQ